MKADLNTMFNGRRTVLTDRANDLCDFIQMSRNLIVKQIDTDRIIARIKGTGPWYTYTDTEWSNDEQRFVMLPERITHTHTLEDIKKTYNSQMEDEWCMSHAMDH
jgi:hypothetical protein|tara:strand:+ start:236 stop:550 length:315 start_codon:yes stop_codon:yes gene_type:complete